MKLPLAPKYIPLFIKELRGTVIERIQILVDKYLGELEKQLSDWEKYSENITDIYESRIEELEDEIETLKNNYETQIEALEDKIEYLEEK